MMTIDVKINGETIGHAYIQNIGSVNGDTCNYHVQYSSKKGIIELNVEHKRSYGAEKLVEIAFGKIFEETRK